MVSWIVQNLKPKNRDDQHKLIGLVRPYSEVTRSMRSMEKISPIATADHSDRTGFWQFVPIFGDLRHQPRPFPSPIPNKRGLHQCQLSESRMLISPFRLAGSTFIFLVEPRWSLRVETGF